MRRRPAILLLAIASACGADSSVAPTPTTSHATLDQALTELALPLFGQAGASITGLYPGTASLGTARCPYTAASQSFVCSPATASGITINQSFTLLTAAGATQSAFDQATTESVRANTAVTGTVSGEGSVMTIDAQQALTLSGLVSGPHMLNGTSTAHIYGTIFSDGAAPVDIRITSAITNLVLPANGAATTQAWPLSGTIVVEASATVSDLVSTSRLTMTFAGSSTVTVTIVEDGLSQTCRIDLAKPDAVPACS